MTQISELFMLTAPHTWFIVAQVMSFDKWLSIFARSDVYLRQMWSICIVLLLLLE